MTDIPRDVPIEEIREIRRQISERFEHDPEKLVAHYLQSQKQFGNRLVRPEKRDERADPNAA